MGKGVSANTEHRIVGKDEWRRYICSCGEVFLSLRAANGHIQAKIYHSRHKLEMKSANA